MAAAGARARAVYGRRLTAAVLAADLLVAGFVAFSLQQSRRQFEERSAVSVANLSQVLERDVAGTADRIDLALQAVADEYARLGAGGRLDATALDAFMARLKSRLPDVDALRLADADGIVRYGSDVPAGSTISVADRPHFIRLRQDPRAGLVVSMPQRSRINGKAIISFCRRLANPDGSFAGMVVAPVTLDRFARDFSAVNVGPHGTVSLRDGELRILARYPVPAAEVIGRPLVVPQLQALVESGGELAGYVTSHSVDGMERRYSVRRIDGHSLYIVVGRSTIDDLAAWRREAAVSLVLLFLFAGGMAVAARLIHRAWLHQLEAAEAAAREEEKFHTVADNTYDWEYWQGPEQEIVFMSPSCKRITGYAAEDFAAEPELLARIVHPEDRHMLDAHVHGAMHDENAELDFRIRRRDGQIRWIAHGCRAVVGRDGAFLGRRVSNRDITERRRAEDEVHTLNAELERRVAERTADLEAANRELEEFSYSVSHDLRSPLRAIVGFAQILEEDYGPRIDDEGRRLLAAVRDGGVRMGRLIDGILDFLRLGRTPLRPAQLDMAELAREAFAGEAPAGREVHLAVGELPPARGDRNMVRILFAALLSNAVKFTGLRAGARIEVGGTVGEDGWNEYFVRDNGAGFDMRYAAKLFRVFERLHAEPEFAGTGIGLAMVRRIVHRHGGRVRAEGRVGEGATFYFTLPGGAA